ncbi:MAG: hypothetical protein ACI9O4_000114 [Chitinophagales bacterium]
MLEESTEKILINVDADEAMLNEKYKIDVYLFKKKKEK